MTDQNAPNNLDPKKILAGAYHLNGKKPKKKKILFYLFLLFALALLAELIYLLFIINY